MNPAAFLSGIFISPYVTSRASVQTINMGHIGRWETDWISSEVGRQQAQPVCLLSKSH